MKSQEIEVVVPHPLVIAINFILLYFCQISQQAVQSFLSYFRQG